MSRPCRDCDQPIEWDRRGGRAVPVDPETREDHRKTCPARQGQVPEKLKRPAGHHTAAYKLKRFQECEYSYLLEFIHEEKGDSTSAQDSGKLEHAAVEYVAVERGKANDFARPVSGEELLAAVDAVVSREAWDAESLAHAREVLVAAAPRIDLSFVAQDEHGPFVERKFELPVGAGVIVGGIMDLIEFVGEVVVVRDWKGGAFRVPNPARHPAVGLYAEWARLLWPEREIRVVLQYLALGVEDEIAGPELVNAQDQSKAFARAVMTKTRMRFQDKDAWPATFGGHCARCPFTAKCETYKARMGERPDGSEPETLEEIVPVIHRLAPVATIFEKKLKALRTRALALAAPHVNAKGRAHVNGYPIHLKTITRKGYSVKESTYQQIDVDDPEPLLEVAPSTPTLPTRGNGDSASPESALGNATGVTTSNQPAEASSASAAAVTVTVVAPSLAAAEPLPPPETETARAVASVAPDAVADGNRKETLSTSPAAVSGQVSELTPPYGTEAQPNPEPAKKRRRRKEPEHIADPEEEPAESWSDELPKESW